MLRLLAVLAITITPLAARADYPRSVCGSIGGFTGCAADYGKGGDDLLVMEGPAGVERIRVQCKGTDYTWQSFGPNNQSWADGVARAWCGGGS